ncbi:MAG: thiolase family protein [Candidatus Marinimicrobia bacterium]|jgi:3-oxoadipyl-CoA thiolase|nr:thiolase family protein [Candidatus Neomarinimicrobiota bacterium]MBT3848896.1 thiolase family protein [Candidatus Neomarinimicrobiota bacterium]MBT4055089.1 thiolase family protein [Candidatus Neomarinimicrobiota bacterium]MBT4662586.1 thiolase family protein [Candidatus Neomarinimicrobiota bacterium]MBT5226045.1 thiolase family protein [Candidatus Neomarinimicrobiota bacterium]
MREVVIIDAVRSPIGRAGGALSSVRPDDLLADVLKGLIKRTGIDPALIEDVYAGCGNQAGEDNRDVARMAVLLAGFPLEVGGVTVNRNCSSGLEAVNQAAKAIIAGEGDIFIGSGVESMSRAPLVMPRPSTQSKLGHRTVFDSTVGWRFENPKMDAMYPIVSLGETAEKIAEELEISRKDQDKFSLESQQKAIDAINQGKFKNEICPISVPQRKGDPLIVDIDEHPRYKRENSEYSIDLTLEKLSSLKPIFRKNGTVTAGNSSGINDGAAAVLLMSREKADELGLKPLARWVGSAVAGVDPSIMGYGPVPSTEKLLNRFDLTLDDIGLIELNEAFASQSIGVMRKLNLNPDITNVNGGAIALGHPLGCSGARILTTLIHEMKKRDTKYGLATLCVGVGQGVTTLVEGL